MSIVVLEEKIINILIFSSLGKEEGCVLSIASCSVQPTLFSTHSSGLVGASHRVEHLYRESETLFCVGKSGWVMPSLERCGCAFYIHFAWFSTSLSFLVLHPFLLLRGCASSDCCKKGYWEGADKHVLSVFFFAAVKEKCSIQSCFPFFWRLL